MRIIAGELRGCKLQVLEGEDTRPTLERVKEGIFSSIHFLVEGARVLDLFAGSGQLGLEALSRGASFAVFIDQNPAATAVVTKNCKDLGVFSSCRVATMPAESFLAGSKEQFDIVFLDPPYHNETLARLLPAVSQHTAPGGIVLCESELKAEMPEQVEELKLVKQYRYGSVLVTKYRKDGE
jgi:16S rRNA (guanine(966)-N(2))-methyltransferase RsmD